MCIRDRKQTATDEQFTPNDEEEQQPAIELFKQLHTCLLYTS